MESRYTLLRDYVGGNYQLLSPSEAPHPAAQRMTFYCPELTKRFLCSLKVPRDFWRRRFSWIGSHEWMPDRLDDHDILEAIAGWLINGSLRGYEFPRIDMHSLRDGKGAAFRFVRGPDPFPTDKACLLPSSEQEADNCLAGLRASAAYWHDLLQENGLLPQGVHPKKTSEGEYRTVIKRLLLSRELLLYKTHDAPAPPKSGSNAQLENTADTPGNRKAHLVAPPTSKVGEAETVSNTEELAGTAPITNPGYPAAGRTDNCVNCAIATDRSFAGHPTSALPQFDPKGVPISEIPKALGLKSSFARVKTLDDVTTTFGEFGAGSRGIVFGDRGPGQVGHVFNVVVDQRGAVKFWDGQSMSRPTLEGQGYKNFWWIRSDK